MAASPSLHRLAAVLSGLAVLGGVSAIASSASRDDARPAPAAIVVDLRRPGRAVPRSFLGLSIEYPSVPRYFGAPGHPNRAFLALVHRLAVAQHGAPALRIGGNSADVAWWDPAGAPGPPQIRTDLSPRWLASVAAVEARTHAPLTLTLDLALEQPANALAFVRAAQAQLPPGSLQALELGNEPDLYAHRQPTPAGMLGPPRFPLLHRYPPARYQADVARYVAALGLGLRHPPALVVGSFAGRAWNRTIPPLLHALGGRVRRVGVHAYPLYGCHRGGPRPGVSVAGLLAARSSRGLAARVAATIAADRVPASAVRVGELNSVTCGGLRGVSDTFASALWVSDTLFALLHAGVAGADIHTLNGAPYAPFAFSAGPGAPRAQVRPLYDGLLLFARAAPFGSRLAPVALHGGGGLRAWATVDARRTVRLLVINPSTTAGRTLTARIAGRRGAPAATVQLLRAPSAAATSGVTLAGQVVGADGALHGPLRMRRLGWRQGRVALALPPASAALITAAAPGAQSRR